MKNCDATETSESLFEYSIESKCYFGNFNFSAPSPLTEILTLNPNETDHPEIVDPVRKMDNQQPISSCINITDAFRAGIYEKSFCLVNKNFTFEQAARNCAKQGMSIYNPMPIEDPLFFYINGNQGIYNETEQIFIAPNGEYSEELHFYCIGYIMYRGFYQKSSINCAKLGYSFCEFKKPMSEFKKFN